MQIQCNAMHCKCNEIQCSSSHAATSKNGKKEQPGESRHRNNDPDRDDDPTVQGLFDVDFDVDGMVEIVVGIVVVVVVVVVTVAVAVAVVAILSLGNNNTCFDVAVLDHDCLLVSSLGSRCVDSVASRVQVPYLVQVLSVVIVIEIILLLLLILLL